MKEEYRGFNLYGGCEPVSETLLGQVTQRRPIGCVAYTRRAALERLRLLAFNFRWSLTMRSSRSGLGWRLPECYWTPAIEIL